MEQEEKLTEISVEEIKTDVVQPQKRGRGRPPKGELLKKKLVSIMLQPGIIIMLDKCSVDNELNRSTFIEKLISDYYFENKDKIDSSDKSENELTKMRRDKIEEFHQAQEQKKINTPSAPAYVVKGLPNLPKNLTPFKEQGAMFQVFDAHNNSYWAVSEKVLGPLAFYSHDFFKNADDALNTDEDKRLVPAFVYNEFHKREALGLRITDEDKLTVYDMVEKLRQQIRAKQKRKQKNTT